MSDEAGARPHATFAVGEMDCAACATTVERAVGAIEGVERAHVSYSAGTLSVVGNVEAEAVRDAVHRAGFTVRATGIAGYRPSYRRRMLWTLLSLVLVVGAYAARRSGLADEITELMLLASVAAGGWPVARRAAAALRALRFDIHVLVSTAVLAALAIGHTGEAAWLVVLFGLGAEVEAAVLNHGRRAVEHLAQRAPDHARVLRGAAELRIPASELVAGDLVVVACGAVIPADGTVADGQSAIGEASVTGAWIAAEKGEGDRVLAGSRNLGETITVCVLAPPAEAMAAQALSVATDDEEPTGGAARFLTRFAAIYTPVVLAAAVGMAAAPLAGVGDSAVWLHRALTVLLVACPCALVIAVPVAVVTSMLAATRRGLLITDRGALEALGRARVIVFDKTATLTRGRPELVSIITVADITEDHALFLAATLEQDNEHPLAGALLREAEGRQLTLGLVDHGTSHVGIGRSGSIGTQRLWIGGLQMARQHHAPIPDALIVIEQRGETAVVLGSGDEIYAAFGLADDLRPAAQPTIQQLTSLGVQSVMLTGDNPHAAARTASSTGIERWSARMLPAHKADTVRALKDLAGPVAVVGDGVNDVAALQVADVGIAMGTSASPRALHASDVTLLDDELTQLPAAIKLGRRTRHVVAQNVAVALGSKALFIGLAATGVMTPVDAVVADIAVALLVCVNALRLASEPRRSSRGAR